MTHFGQSRYDARTLAFLRQIKQVYPTIDAALSRIAALEASLTLPKETVHVISDIHGEFKKLRHVINNASGSLRPIVEELFAKTLDRDGQRELLNLIHYPSESWALISANLKSKKEKQDFLVRILPHQFTVLRDLAKRNRLSTVEEILPADYRSLLRELLFAPQLGRSEGFLQSVVAQFVELEKELDLLRLMARVIRNLLVAELVVAGDMGDRGPRIDKVIDYLMRQPRVSITWGNHDVSWLGACLGHEASIATVLRISLRYRRLSQLEEGYGIMLEPLEALARTVYGEDPAECFACKGEGLRDSLLMARMQKAIAIIQFKLEGQLSERNPQFGLENRTLLHQIDSKTKTVTIDGKSYPLRDPSLPTIDWNAPFALSVDEQKCLDRIKKSFVSSAILWNQMKFLVEKGCMYLARDNHLIFHGCVPVDEAGNFLSLSVDGKLLSGRALFDALELVVVRALREKKIEDLDMLLYLWSGALSPLFGKDKMATFETYFVADKETHHESKNPYFKLIHQIDFCRKILAEFGIQNEKALIVNGHVPVKIEKGESPLKQSNLAVTIDGAFSEAYGDRGYSLVLEAHRTYLAQHHHFDSALDSIVKGTDIIPEIQELRSFVPTRTINDTEEGDDIRNEVALLKQLIGALRDNAI